MAFLPLLALSTLQMTPASIGLVLSVYLLIDAGTQGLSGPLVDRSNKIALIAICSIIGSAFLFLVPHAQSGGILLAVLLPFSILSGVARGGVEALNVEMGREYRQMGTVMGIFMGAACLGQMSGPMVFGYTMDVLDLNTGFTIGATVGVIGGLVTTYLLVKWTTRQRAAFRNTQ